MNKAEYLELVNGVFAHSPAGSGSLVDFVHFTNDGVLAIAKDDGGTLGFGIAAGITPSFSVLSAVNDLNRLMSYGNYWLAEGADNDNWSLVCGFKFSYDLVERQYVGELATAMAQHSSGIVGVARQKLADTAHRPYWSADTAPEVQAFVLLGHLG